MFDNTVKTAHRVQSKSKNTFPLKIKQYIVIAFAISALALSVNSPEAFANDESEPWSLAKEFENNSCAYKIYSIPPVDPKTKQAKYESHYITLWSQGIGGVITNSVPADKSGRAQTGERIATDQDWFIYPDPEKPTTFLIQTVTNGEFMSITDPFGIARRWARVESKSDNSQNFKFINFQNPSTLPGSIIGNIVSPVLNIQEGTRNEYVTATPNNDIRRWSTTNERDQQFQLERVACNTDNTKKPIIEQIPYRIPSFQNDSPLGKGKDINEIPMKLREYIVAVTTLSALVVDDKRYPNKLTQMKATPWYNLVQKQYWDRGKDRGYYKRIIPKSDSINVSFQTQNGFSSSNMTTITHTEGWEVNAGLELQAGATLGDPKQGPSSSKGAKLNLAAKYNVTNTTVNQSGSANNQLNTKIEGETLSSSEIEYTVVYWALVDKFELIDSQGNIANTIEYVDPSLVDKEWYPRDNQKLNSDMAGSKPKVETGM